MARDDDVTGISLRFKYGTQTVFLFVDQLAKFAEISEELLDVLRESYPNGLIISASRPGVTPVPKKGDTYRVSYAVPKNPRDFEAGWKPLDTSGEATPSSLKLRENTALAFAIQTEEALDSEPVFTVDIPVLIDEE
ncbi:hypothetical protein SPI_08370 [Niveomyces insectorum RCEF 264]|uniref:Uncharacterized protein n=1 Tax=Niveomyces insectorum RCEF 264 TaxID=1081102 RepID=A0A162ICR8_9HYPO|nr:hypothetical protein SPI_08370 [Niveomyces insectorum RCEF 264]